MTGKKMTPSADAPGSWLKPLRIYAVTLIRLPVVEEVVDVLVEDVV